MISTRRHLVLGSLSAAAVSMSGGLLPLAAAASAGSPWARGYDGQRKGDLGNGRFLNPVLAGDHPDPNVLKDGDD